MLDTAVLLTTVTLLRFGLSKPALFLVAYATSSQAVRLAALALALS